MKLVHLLRLDDMERRQLARASRWLTFLIGQPEEDQALAGQFVHGACEFKRSKLQETRRTWELLRRLMVERLAEYRSNKERNVTFPLLALVPALFWQQMIENLEQGLVEVSEAVVLLHQALNLLPPQEESEEE